MKPGRKAPAMSGSAWSLEQRLILLWQLLVEVVVANSTMGIYLYRSFHISYDLGYEHLRSDVHECISPFSYGTPEYELLEGPIDCEHGSVCGTATILALIRGREVSLTKNTPHVCGNLRREPT